MDGNQWCAVEDDFINLQESCAGFGNTETEALVDFIKQLYKRHNYQPADPPQGLAERMFLYCVPLRTSQRPSRQHGMN